MPAAIQRSDFYVSTSILHPLVVGSIMLLIVYLYVRLASARSLSGMTVFSMLVNLALGGTMSDIVTTSKTDLARGLIALAVIFGFEWTTDWLSSRHSHFATLFEKEPQVLVFRGRIIEKALSRNRLSEGAIWMTLRQNGCSDVSEVEAVVLEMSGDISVVKALQDPTTAVPALERLPQYVKLRDQWRAVQTEAPAGRASLMGRASRS